MPSSLPKDSAQLAFTFKNIGPIKDAELELGDLTIIAGRNNTGKTYLVYALYGFLKMWPTWPGFTTSEARNAPSAGSSARHTLFDRILDKLARPGEARIPIEPATFNRERTSVMRALTREFSRSALSSVFSSPPEAFKGASIAVALAPPSAELRSAEIRVPPDDVLSIRYGGGNLVTTRRATGQTELAEDEILQLVTRLYLRFLFPELPMNSFVLSAERFGISLFYRELDYTKNQLVDVLQKWSDRKRNDPYFPLFLLDQLSRYALPVKHNIDYTRSIPDLRKQRSEIYADGLFNDIRALMKGYYVASSDAIEFRSVARGDRRFAIPLHLASSSVRGLSDLYFFLRHVAREDQLLIIDEPESHLDTANQILLARMLARLVRAGLRVLLTTHSDYLIKELNNLIMLSRPLRNKSKVMKRLKYAKDDSIAPERIRAYVAADGSISRCEIDKFGIDMPNFDTTINEINDVANELASRLAEDVTD